MLLQSSRDSARECFQVALPLADETLCEQLKGAILEWVARVQCLGPIDLTKTEQNSRYAQYARHR